MPRTKPSTEYDPQSGQWVPVTKVISTKAHLATLLAKAQGYKAVGKLDKAKQYGKMLIADLKAEGLA